MMTYWQLREKWLQSVLAPGQTVDSHDACIWGATLVVFDPHDYYPWVVRGLNGHVFSLKNVQPSRADARAPVAVRRVVFVGTVSETSQ
jgi:hypothetical protein